MGDIRLFGQFLMARDLLEHKFRSLSNHFQPLFSCQLFNNQPFFEFFCFYLQISWTCKHISRIKLGTQWAPRPKNGFKILKMSIVVKISQQHPPIFWSIIQWGSFKIQKRQWFEIWKCRCDIFAGKIERNFFKNFSKKTKIFQKFSKIFSKISPKKQKQAKWLKNGSFQGGKPFFWAVSTTNLLLNE